MVVYSDRVPQQEVYVNRVASIAVAGAVLAGVTLTATPAEAATLQSRALSVAKAQKGDPYQYGAEGPNKFDCSGLIFYSYKRVGKTLARTAQGQYNKSHHVSKSSRRPGDLVFFGSPVYHVGVYVGDGKIVNANTGSYRGRKVVTAPISEYGQPVRYGRY